MAIWTPTQKTKTKKIKEEGCSQHYEVEVPAAKVQEAFHNVYLRFQLRARVAGFRPGKAPLDMVKKQYGGAARSEVIEEVLRVSVPETIKELGLHPIATPVISAIRLESEMSPLTFELQLELAPKFEAKGYKGLAIKRKKYPVSDAQTDSRLAELRETNARLERSAAEAVGKDHYVVLDYELLRGGKLVSGGQGRQELVDMSSDQSVKGLTQGLLSAKRGETREFEVGLDSGPATCKATVVEIKEKVLPSLDDDFAKDMGLESLEALKAKLREILAVEGESKAEREVVEQIEQGLLAANKFSIPQTLSEQQLEHTLERIRREVFKNRTLPDAEVEKLKEKLRPEAENQVRLSFILTDIAQREKIAVSEEDFQEELNKSLAKAQSEDQKRDLREFFEKSKEDIRYALRDRKVLAFIRQAAKMTEETAAPLG